MSGWLLVGANLTALLLFLAYDLTFGQLLLVFWLECFYIGIFGGLRLLIATLFGDPYENRYIEVSKSSGIVLTVLALWSTAGLYFGALSAIGFLLLFPILEQDNAGLVLFENLELCFLVSVVLAVSHAASFVANFVLQRGFRYARFSDLLIAPFRASTSLILVGACAAITLIWLPEVVNNPGYALSLVLLKLVFDLRIQHTERHLFEALGETSGIA
jgi:hypothetical protein